MSIGEGGGRRVGLWAGGRVGWDVSKSVIVKCMKCVYVKF